MKKERKETNEKEREREKKKTKKKEGEEENEKIEGSCECLRWNVTHTCCAIGEGLQDPCHTCSLTL